MRAREGAVRAVIAVTVVVALAYEYVRTAELVGVSVLEHLVDYASYFTTLSNAAAAVTLGVGAVLALHTDRDPDWYGQLVISAIAYTMTTCAVYNISLRPVSTAPDSWANEVLHVVGPVCLALMWAVRSPGRAVPWRSIRNILGVPLAWLGYTMLRGALVGWYPYAFLDPAQAGSILVVGACVCVAAVLITGFALLAVAVTRRRESRIASVHRNRREQLIGAERALGAEHLAPVDGAQQQRWSRADALGLGVSLCGDDISLGRGHPGQKSLRLGNAPPRRPARRAECRGVQHQVHARVNVRRGTRVPARP